MPQLALPAVFMRGGTSRAVMFHMRDLPDRKLWDPIFLAAMGSPDPHGRQLNGMGGGISSLSKICVLSPSARADADIDYTFAQVQIREAVVDYRSNCGNMSSAVGPFAVDEGLVRPNGDTAVVRIFNTNTGKIIRSTFPLADGRAAVNGGLSIPGVAGTGAPVRLDFLAPGGAVTGRLLPTGNVVDRLQRIRRAAAVAMGLAANDAEARLSNAVPAIGFVAPPMAAPTLSGEMIAASQADLTARFLSNGQPHRALPLTASLCTAVAARIEGTIAFQALGAEPAGAVRIAMPSGILTVDADVSRSPAGAWTAHSGALYRTARRLFDGRIYVPQADPAT